MVNENYNGYYLFIDWLIHPNRFFRKVSENFVRLSGIKKNFVLLLSYLIPLSCAFELYGIWSRFAIYIIADRIVPSALVLVIFILFIAIINSILFGFLPRGFKKDINRQLQQQGNGLHMRIFSRLYLLRNNLLFLPMSIVLILMMLTNISRTWNIYLLGTYLTISAWILLFWIGYFSFSSLYSMGAEFPHINPPRITKTHLLIKVSFGFALYVIFEIGLTIPLTNWLGAETMPFWFKIAMFFLHGN
ncbi:MAG: hypothetical protein LUQ65_14395 [Candidatus Helarchaeota archaeon]|nr:hypothetical protein [Candidatus Helarchaeota archaeon]